MAEDGMIRVVCDQCQYGMEDLDGNPVKKPRSFLTNSPEIAAQLDKRCFGKVNNCSRRSGGVHRRCRGQVARLAAVYHFKLCRAILVGMRKQLDKDGRTMPGEVGIDVGFFSSISRLNVFLRFGALASRRLGTPAPWRPGALASRCLGVPAPRRPSVGRHFVDIILERSTFIARVIFGIMRQCNMHDPVPFFK